MEIFGATKIQIEAGVSPNPAASSFHPLEKSITVSPKKQGRSFAFVKCKGGFKPASSLAWPTANIVLDQSSSRQAINPAMVVLH